MIESQGPAANLALSRGVITNAAIDFVERRGIEKLSMRLLASELGCGTMSLYSHVKNRDDLIESIVQELLGRSGILEITEGEYSGWREQVTESLHAYKGLAVDYPASFELLALAPYDASPVAGHLERLVGALSGAGLSLELAYEILGTLDAYATGFLVVWTRSGREVAGSEATTQLRDLRRLDAFDRGMERILASFEHEIG